MSGGLSVRIRGGKLGGTDKFMQLLAPPVTRAAMVVQGGVMEASPKREGTLQKSWNTRPATVERVRIVSRVGTKTIYARYQDRRTRNKGYVRRGINAAKARALQVLRQGIREAIPQMWVKG